MGQTRLSSIAIINIAISYAKRILQESMDWIIDIFGKIKNSESFLLNTWILDPVCTCCNDFVILSYEDWFNSLNCVLILYKQHSVGFNILIRCNHLFLVYIKSFLNAEVVLIKPFAMDLHSLIGYIPRSTNQFYTEMWLLSKL